MSTIGAAERRYSLGAMTDTDTDLAVLQRDNAALRRRVAELEAPAARYAALRAVTPDLLLVIDKDGGYVDIEATRGFPSELIAELIGSNLRERFIAPLADEMVAAVRRALATGEAQRLEYTVMHAGDIRHTAVLTPLTADTVLWFSQDVTAARQLERAERGLRTYEAIIESSPDGVALLGPGGAYVYMNRSYRALVGLADAAAGGPSGAHAVDPAAVDTARATGGWQGSMILRREDASDVACQVALVRLQGAGADAQIAVIARDMTPFIEAEQQRIALREQVITAQRDALRELSTPLVPLADGVVAMPLLGTLDAERAQRVMERLLEGVARERAHTAILDITGVRTLDADAADALLRVAGATRLLGARVILTGIGPDVARTLVDLRLDLRGVTTRDTLQSGIAEALRVARA